MKVHAGLVALLVSASIAGGLAPVPCASSANDAGRCHVQKSHCPCCQPGHCQCHLQNAPALPPVSESEATPTLLPLYDFSLLGVKSLALLAPCAPQAKPSFVTDTATVSALDPLSQSCILLL